MRYRKVSCAIWADEKIRTLNDKGRLGFLYLLTHPALGSVGAMRGTLAGLAAELGWSLRTLKRALAPAIEAGMIEVNAAACYLGLPNFLKHNLPENPNVAKAWAAAIAALPECPERQRLVERCRAFLDGTLLKAFEERFAQEFGEPFPKGMPNQEQEQEQEQRTGAGGIPPTPLEPLASKNGDGRHGARRVKL